MPRYLLPLLFALNLFGCDMAPQGSCDPSLPGCSVPPAPAADDDDSTTPEPTPECDENALADAMMQIEECPEGTYHDLHVECSITGWVIDATCVQMESDAVEPFDCIGAFTLADALCDGTLAFTCEASTGYVNSVCTPNATDPIECPTPAEVAASCENGLASYTCNADGSYTAVCAEPATELVSPPECESAEDAADDCAYGLESYSCTDGDVEVTCFDDDTTPTGDDDDDDTTPTGDDDDDDTTPTGDDDDTTTASADVLGNYGCVHLYDAPVIAWIVANGLPTNLVRQDNNADGVYDNVWVSAVLDWTELGILDLDSNGVVDSSDWTCSSWADGTDDAVDNDGDGYTEAGGDLDDGTSGNRPGATDVCGDALDNDYDGLLDEECTSDADGDGESELQGDCNDSTSFVGVAPVYEYNDGVDNDCDGLIDEPSSVDGDGDGYTEAGGDCNDAAASIYPSAFDWGGDGVDQDCDGTDE